eukprot:g21760.t1
MLCLSNREQLKLERDPRSTIAVLSIVREVGENEELFGQCVINVEENQLYDAWWKDQWLNVEQYFNIPAKEEVHHLKLLDAGGQPTEAEVRLRLARPMPPGHRDAIDS